MKKGLSSLILSFLFIFTLLTPIVSAATTGSVTSTRAQNSAKWIEITGSGKKMTFTASYSGSGGSYGGDAVLYKKLDSNNVQHIATLYVRPNKRFDSTDVLLDKNATYILQADVDVKAASNASVTASIR
ncbi:hypothetical protein [Paenibacillus sp. B1-33]|uniref:hypothetical protein n=1 Tax=unclassified Paenibacillus TaxID=185978 RepID=UPI003D2A2B7E